MQEKNNFGFKKIRLSSHLRQTITISIVTVVVIFALLSLLIWIFRAPLFNYFAGEYMQSLQSESTPSDSALSILSQQSFVVDAVKKSNPAVVSIVISKDVPTYEQYFAPNQSPFGDLFGSPFGSFFNVPQYRQNGTEKQEVGGGSGFLVSKDGMIVTNKHVVADTEAEYTVFLNNGEKYTATVLDRDSVLDIAIIKISGPDFPYLSFGDSDALQLGQTTIAIGNALGEFKNTVSVGVISGLSRSITAGDGMGESELLDHVIQTDAAINPGNSGGPLLDLSGNVVGVNVAVAQGSQSIGFALPINSIKSVVESVESTGKIVRPYIGIRYTTITPELKEKNNLSVDYGILVQRGATAADLAVIPGSPADKAGIVENDIILEIDGKKIDEDVNFAYVIREKKVGDTVVLKILSKGIEKTVSVILEAAP